MEVLIGLGLIMGACGLGAFLWSLRNGQYEDLDGAAVRILDDDEDEAPQTEQGHRPAKGG